MDWASIAVCFTILTGAVIAHASAVKKRQLALDALREAGDAYMKAVHEREEAHRVLAHVKRIENAAPISEEKETSP